MTCYFTLIQRDTIKSGQPALCFRDSPETKKKMPSVMELLKEVTPASPPPQKKKNAIKVLFLHKEVLCSVQVRMGGGIEF